MNAERLEELRRKLREGHEVDVRGGEVTLTGEAASPALTPTPGVPPAPPQPGLRVKAHEWGTAPLATTPFYATPKGEERLFTEQGLLAREYPSFQVDLESDGIAYAHGFIGPHASLRQRYHVLLVLPPGYGSGAMPLVQVLFPEIREGAPHRFVDGSLCLDHSGAFHARSTLLTLLGWVSVWLVLYEGWLDTGRVW